MLFWTDLLNKESLLTVVWTVLESNNHSLEKSEISEEEKNHNDVIQ